MRFGVIANFGRPDAAAAVETILDWCDHNGHEAFVCENVITGPKMDVKTVTRSELCVDSDIVISLGGDGTMLATARAMGDKEIPILGINLGYLGFLTQLTPEQLKNAMDRVAADDYQIEERMLLKTNVIDGPQLESRYALNDVVIDKGAVSRVINMSLYANDEYICSYTADGLIIATPTGSTAYSLAVGGPILNPYMKAFIASPISPFSLTSRPMVFPADVILEVRIRSEHGNANLTIDGQVATNFSPTGIIRITRADHVVKFIKFEENSFYDVLRRKLHWGRLPVVDYEKADLLKKEPPGGHE